MEVGELKGTKLEELLDKAEILDSIKERKNFIINNAGKNSLVIDSRMGLRVGILGYNEEDLRNNEYVLISFGSKHELKNIVELYFFR